MKRRREKFRGLFIGSEDDELPEIKEQGTQSPLSQALSTPLTNCSEASDQRELQKKTRRLTEVYNVMIEAIEMTNDYTSCCL